MALLTVTDAAKAAGVSRTTLYEKIKDGDISRNADKLIDTADLLRVFGELQADQPNTPEAQPTNSHTDELLALQRETIERQQRELDDLRVQADQREQVWLRQLEKTQALLPAPESRDADREAISQLGSQMQSMQEQFKTDSQRKDLEWKEVISERRHELTLARAEADQIRESEQQAIERQQQSQAELEAMQKRSFIDRLLNRKPATSV